MGKCIQNGLRVTALLCSLISLNAYAGKRVAVVVDGNDQTYSSIGNLSGIFDDSASKAEALYRQRGYEVIRIDASKGMNAADFNRIVNGLNDVGDVSFSFFSHGAVRNVDESFESGQSFTAVQLKRFPKTYLRPDEIATQLADDQDPIRGPIHFGFAMQISRPNDGEFHAPTWNEDFIGLGDLHDSLSGLKQRNPKVRINIASLACFSGNVVRALQDIPDVQVFAGSSASQSADVGLPAKELKSDLQNEAEDRAQDLLACSGLKCKQTIANSYDFIGYFLQKLGQNESYADAFSEGRTQYLRTKLDFLDIGRSIPVIADIRGFLIRPQSSVELLFADQCLGAPPATEVQPFCRKAGDLDALQKLVASSTQPGLIQNLRKEVDEDDAYLSSLEILYGCDTAQQSKETDLIKQALLESKSVLEKRRSQLSQKDIDEIIRTTKELSARARSAKTPQELLQATPDNLHFAIQIGVLKKQLKSPDVELFKQTQEGIVDGLDDIQAMFAEAGFLDRAKSQIKEASADMDKGSSDFKKCLNSPLGCDSGVLYGGIDTAFSYFHPQAIGPSAGAMDSKAQIVLVNDCPSSKVFNRGLGGVITGRNEQIKCILDHTSADPVLRVHTLLAVVMPIDASKREASCKLIRSEEEKDKKLLQCAAHPDQTGGDEFWNQISAVYLQEQSAPGK